MNKEEQLKHWNKVQSFWSHRIDSFVKKKIWTNNEGDRMKNIIFHLSKDVTAEVLIASSTSKILTF